MISTSKIGISRFFHEIFNFHKTSEQNKSLILFNTFWVACIINHWIPSIKGSPWIGLLVLLSIFIYNGFLAYCLFKKPSMVWFIMLLSPICTSSYLRDYSHFWGEQLVLAATIVSGYYFSRKIYLAPRNNKGNTKWELSFMIFWAILLFLSFLKTEGIVNTTTSKDPSSFLSNLISEEEVKESSLTERLAEYFIKNAEKDSWRLVIPQTKGDGALAYSNIYNYLRWLNSHTGKNFSNDLDLKIKTPDLAQNITRLGETAFCINQLIDNDYSFLKANDKLFILESTLVWFKEKQRFLKPIKSKPVFFIDGKEQEVSCSQAINRLLDYWSIEITKQKEADLYKTLVIIYGAEQAEIILGQLILTNAVGMIPCPKY